VRAPRQRDHQPHVFSTLPRGLQMLRAGRSD
jgi:hypothetical protein